MASHNQQFWHGDVFGILKPRDIDVLGQYLT